MDVKQERFDPTFKTEPKIVGHQLEEDKDSKTFKNEYYDDLFEIIEQEVPKLEQSELTDLPIKLKHDAEYKTDTASMFPTTIKKELDVTAGDIKTININQEGSEYVQPKIESEFLTSYCDLPTLKIENSDYEDYSVQSCSNKRTSRLLKPIKTNLNVVSKKNNPFQYPCLVCQKNFPSSKSRSTHIVRHFGKCPVVCEFCGKSMTKNEYLRHYFIHVVKNGSNKVSQKFIEVSSLKSHLIINASKTFKCNICLKEFKWKCHFQRHLIIHGNDKPFKCDICSREFKHNSSLQYHLVIHSNEKPFKCDICSREFTHKPILQRHLLIHTKKTFECDICSEEFKFKSHLWNHLLIHGIDKPFKCDICSKEFKRKTNLHIHLLIHSADKSFKCDICSREFTQKNSLQRHLLIHTNEKPFKCSICSKEFKEKFRLRNHLLIHGNDKPFKCDICSREFTQKSSFQRHSLIHTKAKSFKCRLD